MCEVCETDASAASLTRALNELQAFNIIPDDLSVIYVHGRFYAPSPVACFVDVCRLDRYSTNV